MSLVVSSGFASKYFAKTFSKIGSAFGVSENKVRLDSSFNESVLPKIFKAVLLSRSNRM